MAAIPSETERDLTPPTPAPAAPAAIDQPTLEANLEEHFLRFIVAGVGIGIGLIAAVIIGFVAGWIQIC